MKIFSPSILNFTFNNNNFKKQKNKHKQTLESKPCVTKIKIIQQYLINEIIEYQEYPKQTGKFFEKLVKKSDVNLCRII